MENVLILDTYHQIIPGKCKKVHD